MTQTIAHYGCHVFIPLIVALVFYKSNWKIVTCNGHKDSAMAVKHAEHLIDGDNFVCWVPDSGEGTNGFPYHVVIDLGEPQSLKLAGIRYLLEAAATTKVTIEGSMSPEVGFQQIGNSQQAKFNNDLSIELDSKAKVRFVRFTFKAPSETGKVLMVGELDLR